MSSIPKSVSPDSWTYESISELSKLPVGALKLATADTSLCGSKNCTNQALVRNYGRCWKHSQAWFPTTKNGKSQPGYLLLGPEFIINNNGHKRKYLCGCGSDLCNAIGYCDHGRFFFPKDETHRQEWFQALNWNINPKDIRNKFNKDAHHQYLAFWHFPEEHRSQDENKQWILNERQQPWVDEEGKKWSCRVPINPSSKFKEEAILSDGIRMCRRRGLENAEICPVWLRQEIWDDSKKSPPPPVTSSSHSKRSVSRSVVSVVSKRKPSVVSQSSRSVKRSRDDVVEVADVLIHLKQTHHSTTSISEIG
mmetsp:Transcript_6097/g.7483  ORF Transcript_6097/g.7483 Transcript_6097/m.7483 type:complete len:308 (+) Transcript_6097:94-1017(+)